MSNKKYFSLKNFNFIFTAIYISIFFTPYINRNISDITLLFVISAWIITALLLIYPNPVRFHKYILVLMIWLFYIFVLRILNFSTTLWGNIFIQPFVFFPILIAGFYIKYMNLKFSERLLKFVYLVASLNIISNLYLNIKYPGSSELINYTSSFEFTNVGGTEFSLFVMLFLLLNLVNLFRINKIIRLFMIFTSATYLFVSGRFITIGIMFIGITLLIIVKWVYSSNLKNSIFKIILLINVAIFIFSFLPDILDFVIQVINPNTRIYLKLIEVKELLYIPQYIDSSTIKAPRLVLYNASIVTLFSSAKNFIFGVGEHTFVNIPTSISIGVGNHSEFLDLGAQYGMIGIIFVSTIFYSFYKHNLKSRFRPKKTTNYLILIFFVFILYSFLNNSFFAENTIVVFLVLPLIRYTNTEMRYRSD